MSRRYRLNDGAPQASEMQMPAEQLAAFLNEEHDNNQKVSGIEVDENHVYFYTGVSEKESLELVRILRKLDLEMMHVAYRLGLKETPPIHLHVHSPGGDIFSGLNICDAIDQCKTDVYTYVEGSAASAGTLITTRGDKRFISKNSFMLLHQPQIMWAGKHDEFMDEIENQKHIFSIVKRLYLESSKITEEELENLLQHELWLPAERCLELGFVDQIL